MLGSDIEGLSTFFQIVQKGNLKKLISLGFFLFIGILIESFGLGILYPIFNSILNQEKISFIGIQIESNYIPLSLGLVCIVYLLKTIYITILTIQQNKFIAYITEKISNEIYSGYILSSYEFHQKFNSAELIKNIQVELSNFTAYLSAVIYMISDSILTISLICVLIYLNPTGTLFLLLYILTASLIFLFITKKKLDIWGSQRLKIDGDLALILTESLKGIKEIKVSMLENLFLKKYKIKNSEKFSIYWKQLTFGQIPRTYLEFISILGFILFIIYLLSEEHSLNEILPIITVYIAAFFRALPSINKLLTSYQQLRYYLPSVILINREINYNRNNNSKRNILDKFKIGIFLNEVSFNYGNNKVLNKISLEFQKGKIYGINGPSGSGKTTLASIILGLLIPTEGSIKVDNQEVTNFKWSRILSYVSQNIFLFDLTILENICLGIDKSKIDLRKVDEVLKKTNLYDWVYSLRDGLNTQLGENATNLSGGQSQRLALARALYSNPQILILDEFTSALDDNNEKIIVNSLKQIKRDITIIIITHKKDILRLFDKVYYI